MADQSPQEKLRKVTEAGEAVHAALAKKWLGKVASDAKQELAAVVGVVELTGNTPSWDCRPKAWSSIEPKAQEGVKAWTLGDLVAVRATVLVRDEIDWVKAMTQSFHATTPQARQWNTNRGRNAGYAGVHVQVEHERWRQPPDLQDLDDEIWATLNVSRESVVRWLSEEFTIELQIRTQLQHVWAEMSHRDFYKPKTGATLELQARMFRLAASLDLLDQEMTAIWQGVAEIKRESPLASTRLKDASRRPLDEHTVLFAGTKAIPQKFEEVRKWAAGLGYTESGWDEHVRLAHEMDVFLEYTRDLELSSVETLLKLLDTYAEYENHLTAVLEELEDTGVDEDVAFARPLYILTFVLAFQHPDRPPVGFRPELAEALSRAVLAQTTSLPEAPQLYFDLDAEHKMVALDDLEPAKPAEYVAAQAPRAALWMHRAARGKIPPRQPLTVKPRGNGNGYVIVDGNSTYGAVSRSGWSQVPVAIEAAEATA